MPPRVGASMLEVRDLHVRYGDMHAVRGVSFTVGAGEAVGIIGANGAGKTTTLLAVLGLVPATGEVRLAGEPIMAWPPWRRAEVGLAWVPEGRRVFGDLTVAENLEVGAYRLRGRVAVRRELDRVYSLFPRLAERRTQRARTLSGGEQQMLALGRALVGRPRVLLVDEASLGLAPIFVERVFESIRRLIAEGTTLLLVEQNVRQALTTVGRAYVLEVGRIVREGPAAALAADPRLRDAYLGA
jgi:branched-chain amino acid transport system ATP-binding protein